MIKVNLCPVDELDNEYWYIPDILVLIAVGIGAFIAVNNYHDTIREKIDALTTEHQSKVEATNKLTPDLERFKNLGSDIAQLESKIRALQTITVSKLGKYKLVIALEHLQNFKPSGLWLTHISLGSAGKTDLDLRGQVEKSSDSDNDNSSYAVEGQAFDNILTAEYMSGMRSTQNQDEKSVDPRTKISFENIVLKSAKTPIAADSDFDELSIYPEFKILGRIVERAENFAPEKANPLQSFFEIPPPMEDVVIRNTDTGLSRKKRSF
ncbi:MAG: hypothetical protein FJ146_08920 [Deltaproteobacteria bacterium]|nr:hypothetical protein [Deltaproteobacteria bacterium]